MKGLDDVPRADWPHVPIVHTAFQLMVGLGTFMALVGALGAAALAFRRRDLCASTWFLRALALAAPMGFIAIEAGWTVTEVGRQPWIVYGVLRTADAVTPMPGLIVPFLGFTAALLLPRRDRGLAALPPDHPEPARHRVEPACTRRRG